MGNAITLVGTRIPTAEATDPELCRISGYLKNTFGQPLAGYAFVLRSSYAPMTVSTDTLIGQERLVVTANAQGYVEFDAIRGAVVTLELPNLLATVFKTCTVPDAASADLIDFLFPYLAEVRFNDTSPLLLVVGQRYRVGFTGVLSNGEEISLAAGLVFESSDDDVLAWQESLVFAAVGVGTATITVTSADTTILMLNQDRYGVDLVMPGLPDPILPTPLTVTVS